MTSAGSLLPLILPIVIVLTARAAAQPEPAVVPPAIRFNTNFEGASLGKVEVLDPATFRCARPGQYDERGRNRQTSWFYFRMDAVRGRAVTLTMTDLVGEYNDRPGAVPYGPEIVPVFSTDGRAWRHFDPADVTWDDAKKEMSLRLKPDADAVWIAHIPPYTPSDLRRLLDDLEKSPHARIEIIGKTAGGRDLHTVTVTDEAVLHAGKRCVWLQARQHAWEAGTSWVMEGALRFIASDEPAAVALRKRVVFRFTPMVDVDGCAAGKVRFNANGFDVNRHWPAVDLLSKDALARMPEVWYTKKAIVSAHLLGPPIDLLLNLHNDETPEYLATFVDDDAAFARLARFEQLLTERTTFDPSAKLQRPRPGGLAALKPPTDTTNSLWAERRIPAVLMELRIAPNKKLGRRPTTEDRLKFGRELVEAMAEAVAKD